MDNLPNISDRLKELMLENETDIKTLEENINITASVILRWTKNYTSIKLSNLIKLSDYFHCSIEYLCGRREFEENFKPNNAPSFSSSLRKVLKEKNITVYKILKNTKISAASFYIWYNGAEPKLSSLLTLSDYLGCSIDYLVGRE